MTESDIRINSYYLHNGNWSYRDHSAPKIIRWESRDWYAVGECTMSLSDINGVKLTDKELLKFGFEFWGVKSCNEYESYDRWVLHNVIGGTSNFEVHIIHSNYGGIKETEICFSIDSDERQFIHNTDFVHDLQNAYYLSTGHELQYTQAGGV